MGRCRRSLDLAFEGVELGPHPFRVGGPLELEAPLPGLPARVREAKKAERLRLAKTPRRPSLGGVPAELDQARLLGVQLQAELREPVAKIRPEPLGVIPILEPHHDVVSEANDDHVTARVPSSPLVGPEVEDVVQVDVPEQRRNRCPLRNALLERRPRPILDDPRSQPFLDQPQDPLVRDPVLKEPLQPLMVKAGKVLTEIRVEHPIHALSLDPERERIQRMMRAATRPVPIRKTKKVRLVDAVQHFDHRPLEDLVLKRGDPERSLPPVGLRDEHPPRRPRPVAPAMNPSMQIPKVLFEVLPVVLPRHAVYPRRGLGLKRPIRRPRGDRHRHGAGAP